MVGTLMWHLLYSGEPFPNLLRKTIQNFADLQTAVKNTFPQFLFVLTHRNASNITFKIFHLPKKFVLNHHVWDNFNEPPPFLPGNGLNILGYYCASPSNSFCLEITLLSNPCALPTLQDLIQMLLQGFLN